MEFRTEKYRGFWWFFFLVSFPLQLAQKEQWELTCRVRISLQKPSLKMSPLSRAALKGTNLRGQTQICGFLRVADVSCEHQRFSAKSRVSQMLCFLGKKKKQTPVCSQKFCSQFLCPLTPPPSQPAKWGISSWISFRRASHRIANTQPKLRINPPKIAKLRTNPPQIANKQNYKQINKNLLLGSVCPLRFVPLSALSKTSS